MKTLNVIIILLLIQGSCAENTAVNYNITREDQDAHALESYKRAAKAWEVNNNKLK